MAQSGARGKRGENIKKKKKKKSKYDTAIPRIELVHLHRKEVVRPPEGTIHLDNDFDGSMLDN